MPPVAENTIRHPSVPQADCIVKGSAGRNHASKLAELTANWMLPFQLPTSSSALVELAAVVPPYLLYAVSSLDCLPSCIPSAFLRFLLVGNMNDEWSVLLADWRLCRRLHTDDHIHPGVAMPSPPRWESIARTSLTLPLTSHLLLMAGMRWLQIAISSGDSKFLN